MAIEKGKFGYWLKLYSSKVFVKHVKDFVLDVQLL
jgi:hypothetical protein